jgi:hypothetical protein
VEWSIDVSNREHRAASQLDGRHRHSRSQLSSAQANWEGEETAFSTRIRDLVNDGGDDTRDPDPGGFCVASFTNAQPPSGYRSAPDQRSMSKAMLDAHNAIRARVGVPPLVWADQLAAVAQGSANHLIATNAFSHRPNNQFGENLYAITGGTASPAEVVGMWADEARDYDIRSNTCSGVCGTTHRLSGDRPVPWGVRSSSTRFGRCGSAITTHLGMSSATGLIDRIVEKRHGPPILRRAPDPRPSLPLDVPDCVQTPVEAAIDDQSDV